jgi:hypothetical protein
MKQNKKQTRHKETYNSIIVGGINLESSNLTMDQLIGRVLSIIRDPTFKDYLALNKQQKLLGMASGIG